MKTALFALFCLMLVACTAQQHNSLTGNIEIQKELTRLGALTDQHSVTEADFATIEGMVASDEYAADEVAETKLMVHYGEYSHALHSIGFLSAYVETGKEQICPGHALAHYYVFTKHGETHEAEHALAEAEESYEEWQDGAQAYLAQYPGTEDYDTINARLRSHFDAIDAGNTTASDEETEYLANIVCVTQ